MRIRDYFKQSARCFAKSIVLLAQGVYHTVKRLFTRYPNPTWIVIVLCLSIYCVLKVADARCERDSYSRKNALHTADGQLAGERDKILIVQIKTRKWN